MAPRKPQAASGATKKPSGKTSTGRVVKRPARGYHTFRNGMLNVTPKGDERELVKDNQASPLLSLPAELRNRIWHLVLGGMTIRSCMTKGSRIRKMLPEKIRRSNTLALLRVCRQIYVETALLPVTANALSLDVYQKIQRGISHLRKYMCSDIREVHLEIPDWVRFPQYQPRVRRHMQEMRLSKWLPGLKHINIRVFADSDWKYKDFMADGAFLQQEVVQELLARGYAVTVEHMRLNWYAYHQEWNK